MTTHALNKLSARKVAATTIPGRYSDGGGLYLVVTPTSRKWVFIFTLVGKRREMGLGPLREVSSLEARELAAKAREHQRAGRDPIVERKNLQRSAVAVPYLWRNGGQLNREHRIALSQPKTPRSMAHDPHKIRGPAPEEAGQRHNHVRRAWGTATHLDH